MIEVRIVITVNRFLIFEILYSFILACTAIYSGMNCFFLCPYPIFGVECYLIMSDTFFKIDIAIYFLTIEVCIWVFLRRMCARLQWSELLPSVSLSFLRSRMSKCCNCIKDLCDGSTGCLSYNKGQHLIMSDTFLKSAWLFIVWLWTTQICFST